MVESVCTKTFLFEILNSVANSIAFLTPRSIDESSRRGTDKDDFGDTILEHENILVILNPSSSLNLRKITIPYPAPPPSQKTCSSIVSFGGGGRNFPSFLPNMYRLKEYC